MKKLLTFALGLFAAAAITLPASAQTSDDLTIGSFEFAPPVFVQANPFGGSFFDNFALEVGGRNATFGGNSLVVYSQERAYGDPVGATAYTAFDMTNPALSGLFQYAQSNVVDTALESGALQLAIWQVNGTRDFNVVDDPFGAWALAQEMIAGGNSLQSTLALTSLENKSYNYFVAMAPVPEPSTYLLMALGLAGIALIKLRRA